MNEERQALLDALGGARLPGGTIAWPAVLLVSCAGLLLALLIGVWLRRAWRRRRAQQARLAWTDQARQALAGLDRQLGQPDAVSEEDIEADIQAQRAWVADAARLARRVALAIDARDQIAALSGQAWLQRLDALVGQRVFDVEPVVALASVPYRPAEAVPLATRQAIRDALEALIDAAEQRSRHTPALGPAEALPPGVAARSSRA